ncbi:MAG: hypothetical protein JWO36_118 [Myxococcales bacterium]|nr:hypothetical protein [Myxococcales bacterium]
MNITLVVDEDTVERAREVARQQGTSLNALIREYIERLAGRPTGAAVATRLEAHWKQDPPGHSEPGWRFSRDELYDERLGRYGRKRDDK